MTTSAASLGRHLLGKLVPALVTEPSPALHLHRDLQLDAWDIVDLVICLERHCHIALPDAEFESWETIGDVYRSLERHKASCVATCWRYLIDFLS